LRAGESPELSQRHRPAHRYPAEDRPAPDRTRTFGADSRGVKHTIAGTAAHRNLTGREAPAWEGHLHDLPSQVLLDPGTRMRELVGRIRRGEILEEAMGSTMGADGHALRCKLAHLRPAAVAGPRPDEIGGHEERRRETAAREQRQREPVPAAMPV